MSHHLTISTVFLRVRYSAKYLNTRFSISIIEELFLKREQKCFIQCFQKKFSFMNLEVIELYCKNGAYQIAKPNRFTSLLCAFFQFQKQGQNLTMGVIDCLFDSRFTVF